MARLNPQHDAEIAAWNERVGADYAAWLDSLPRTPRTPWIAANDDFDAANDNVKLEDAA